MVIVAQLVRALVCGAGGRGFESHQSPIFKKKRVDRSTLFYLIYGFIFRNSNSLGCWPGKDLIFSNSLLKSTIVGVVICDSLFLVKAATSE